MLSVLESTNFVRLNELWYNSPDWFEEACENLLPYIVNGAVRPIISRVYKLSEFEKAHQLLKSGNNIGKIVLIAD